MRTNSAIGTVLQRRWIKEYLGYWRGHRADVNEGSKIANAKADYLEYDSLCLKYCGVPLAELSALEIGFGPLPYRLYWLASAGVDVHGIDLDTPLTGFSLRRLLNVARTNGVGRALKSLVRYAAFDRAREKKLSHEIAKEFGVDFSVPNDRLLVGDASDSAIWRRLETPVDLMYSEDVFEHIPAEDLPKLLELMAEHLSDDGIALIRPQVFTGISGGHHPDWYRSNLGRDISRAVGPWSHLREDAPLVNTYLNRLHRSDYRDLFTTRFDIVDELGSNQGLGEEYMTDEIREELAAYDDDELFSNNVLFVLRPKGRPASSEQVL